MAPDRGLATFDHILWPTDRRRRVCRHQLPDNQKIIEHPDGRQLLFDRRLRAGHLLDIGGHVKRPDSVQREPVFLAPVKELVTGPCISQPGVPVPDGGGEEFNIGISSPRAGCGNQVGDPGGSRTTGYDTAKMGVVDG